MLVLNPGKVTFGARVLGDVTTLVVDRSAKRQVIEWSDLGPFPVLADAPEQTVTIKLTRYVQGSELDAPAPGEQDELVFAISPTATPAGRVRVRAAAVVMSVVYDLVGPKGGVQTVTFAAVSGDGLADPLTLEDASDGAE